MKTIARDLSVIVVAMVAGLLFASTVQAHGVGYGVGYKYGHGHQHHNVYRGRGFKWGHGARRHRPARVVYVTRPPVQVQVPVYIPVAAPVRVQAQAANQCREYNSTAVIDGRRVPVYGTVCRQSDGNWRIVD